jgi:hypothetical protein
VRTRPGGGAETPPGKSRCHSGSAQPITLAIAATSKKATSTRTARSSHCSSRSRRTFFFWAASRKRIAAQFTIW